MDDIVIELIDALKEIGLETTYTYVDQACCGEMYWVDYNYNIDSDYKFRIFVKPEKIEISQLIFEKIMISHAEYKTVEQLISTIKHCQKIDKYT